MALSSPGVQVSVIDESFYTPAAAGTVPMIFVASASNKTAGSGTGTAAGTLKANAGKPYLINYFIIFHYLSFKFYILF